MYINVFIFFSLRTALGQDVRSRYCWGGPKREGPGFSRAALQSGGAVSQRGRCAAWRVRAASTRSSSRRSAAATAWPTSRPSSCWPPVCHFDLSPSRATHLPAHQVARSLKMQRWSQSASKDAPTTGSTASPQEAGKCYSAELKFSHHFFVYYPPPLDAGRGCPDPLLLLLGRF